MGNLPNRDTDASRLLSGMLGVSWEDGTSTGYGPFVPDILRPNTYGFGVSDGTVPLPFSIYWSYAANFTAPDSSSRVIKQPKTDKPIFVAPDDTTPLIARTTIR